MLFFMPGKGSIRYSLFSIPSAQFFDASGVFGDDINTLGLCASKYERCGNEPRLLEPPPDKLELP
jgi:hypothetical protein